LEIDETTRAKLNTSEEKLYWEEEVEMNNHLWLKSIFTLGIGLLFSSSHLFSFAGAKIKRIVKDAAEGNWKIEKQEIDSIKIKYIMPKIVNVVQNVSLKVYIETKDDPDNIDATIVINEKIRKTESDINELQGQIDSLDKDISTHRGLINTIEEKKKHDQSSLQKVIREVKCAKERAEEQARILSPELEELENIIPTTQKACQDIEQFSLILRDLIGLLDIL
jgi:archaellum component FlaC